MSLSVTALKDPRLQQLKWQEIPGLIEWQQFSKSSRFSFMDRRNSKEIDGIDMAIGAYERVRQNRSLSLAQESEAVILIFQAIEVYLAVGGHSSRRKNAVKDLRAITLYTLSDLRWQKIKDVNKGIDKGLKPMVEHVWSEVHSPNHARVGHGENSDLAPDPFLRGETEEFYLFQHLRKVREDSGAPKIDTVKYLEDEERWNCQVVFSDDGFAYQRCVVKKNVIVKDKLQLITTQVRETNDLGTAIYAIDEDDVFYFQPSDIKGQLNHCSFLSGRPVKAAGNIGISRGVVGYIDNGSGHYRPSTRHLLKGLEALKKRVGDLIFPWVLVRDLSSGLPTAVYYADKFLNTRGICKPIGYFKSFSRYDNVKDDLVLFKDGNELINFINMIEKGPEVTEARKIVQALMETIDSKKSPKTGLLSNDEERDIFKRAIDIGVFPNAISYEPYIKNDPKMQQWLSYGRKILPTAENHG